MAMRDLFQQSMDEDTTRILRELPTYSANYMKFAKFDDENFISWTEFWKEVRGENEENEEYDDDGEIVDDIIEI